MNNAAITSQSSIILGTDLNSPTITGTSDSVAVRDRLRFEKSLLGFDISQTVTGTNPPINFSIQGDKKLVVNTASTYVPNLKTDFINDVPQDYPYPENMSVVNYLNTDDNTAGGYFAEYSNNFNQNFGSIYIDTNQVWTTGPPDSSTAGTINIWFSGHSVGTLRVGMNLIVDGFEGIYQVKSYSDDELNIVLDRELTPTRTAAIVDSAVVESGSLSTLTLTGTNLPNIFGGGSLLFIEDNLGVRTYFSIGSTQSYTSTEMTFNLFQNTQTHNITNIEGLYYARPGVGGRIIFYGGKFTGMRCDADEITFGSYNSLDQDIYDEFYMPQTNFKSAECDSGMIIGNNEALYNDLPLIVFNETDSTIIDMNNLPPGSVVSPPDKAVKIRIDGRDLFTTAFKISIP